MLIEISKSVRLKLTSIYDEIMWLAQRPGVKPAAARAWYTHIVHRVVTLEIRSFTGNVSVEAVTDETSSLRLEHFKRIQTTLTQLVARHLASQAHDADEFIETVVDCEQVHIVTEAENYAAMKAKGDYALAGIKLFDWKQIPQERRRVLWKKMLNGRVSNAREFAVEPLL